MRLLLAALSILLIAPGAGVAGTRIAPSDGGGGDWFGYSIDLADGLLLVGARDHSIGRSITGAAYLYDVATGQELHKFADAGNRDKFGGAVALGGGFALVGADSNDDRGSLAGSAFLYDATTGELAHELIPSGPPQGAKFGSSTALGNGLALVGAPGTARGGDDHGEAYLFDTATGEELLTLRPHRLWRNLGFGDAVALDGGLALVGAGGTSGRYAYLFDVSSGEQLHLLEVDQSPRPDGFGQAVAMAAGWPWSERTTTATGRRSSSTPRPASWS